MCQYNSYFRVVHIFADIQKTRITRKYVHRGNFYIHSISQIVSGKQSSRLWQVDVSMLAISREHKRKIRAFRICLAQQQPYSCKWITRSQCKILIIHKTWFHHYYQQNLSEYISMVTNLLMCLTSIFIVDFYIWRSTASFSTENGKLSSLI